MKKFYVMISIFISCTCMLFAQETKSPQEITFNVDNVKTASSLLNEVSYIDALKKRFENLESYSMKREALVDIQLTSDGIDISRMHGLILTLWLCYKDHRPLVLSPDMIWLLICHGFAKHVEINAEKLQSKFVKHKDKKKLVVKRYEFNKGNIHNNWEGVFKEFADQIKNHVGQDLYDLIVTDFSTTGRAEKASFEISLMDTVKSYFKYEVWTICGIPSITLEGTPQDWENLLDRTKKLRDYDLEWWIDSLVPILKKFVEASKGTPDQVFWQNIFKVRGGSGGNKVTGWITKFFPYQSDNDKFYVGRPNLFTSGFSEVEFLWIFEYAQYKMQFIAGFVGVSQNKVTKALRPEIGWVIIECSNE